MYNGHRILAVIPARGGSKRIPRKNIKNLNGLPLLAHSIREALESKLVDRVIVSTDDEEIASISARYGADVPFMRPAELAADKSPTVLCIEHALDELAAAGESYDCAVTLQPTNPLRSSDDIDKAIALFYESGRRDVVSAVECEDAPMLIRIVGDGGILSKVYPAIERDGGVLSSLVPHTSTIRTQDMPKLMKVSGDIYVNASESIRAHCSMNDSPIGYTMPASRHADIDTIDDFMRTAARMKSEDGEN